MLIVEDEPLMAEAIRDGLRLEAIAADVAFDGDAALDLLRFNAYDIAVLDRDIPGPSGDEQQCACEHDEPGVAEGELEANAQTGRSIHGLLPRCGSRRRPPCR